MKPQTILIAALAGLSLLAGPIRAQIVASDDFSYPDGNLNGDNGGTGWSGGWVGSYGTAMVVGGQVILPGAGCDAFRLLSSTQVAGTVAWVRFSGQLFTDTPGNNADNFWGGLFFFSGGSQVGFIGKNYAGPYDWTLVGGSAHVSTQSVLSASDIYARVVTTTNNNMTIDLWINPANPSIIDTLTPDATDTFAGNGWDRVYLRSGSGDSSQWSQFENLAIGNTLADVVGNPTLPVTLPGVIYSGSGAATAEPVIFAAGADGWVGTNYNTGSSRTLYTRFSMEFNNVNNGSFDFPNTGGGLYGGLEFFQGGSEKFLIGAGWGDYTWSTVGGAGDVELDPSTIIMTNDWHTMVVRTDYSANNNATVSVWLDPDFTQTEANQPNGPIVLSMDDTFDNIRLRCGNGPASAEFSNIVIAATSAGVGFVPPGPPQFQGLVPGINATYVPPSTPINVDVVFGSYGVNTNAVTLTLDGNPVTPGFTASANELTVHYQPGAPLAAGTTHTVMLSLTDSNGAPYSTSWSFTVDPYPTLPATVAGPFTVSGGGSTIVLNSQDGWIGGNYGAASTNVLYTRFSMEFTDVNNGGLNVPNSGGGCYGGLQFWQGGNQKLLVGAGWGAVNWGVAVSVPNQDLTPGTPIVTGGWHTMVVKSSYVTGGNTAVRVWLDPDFSKAENDQTNAPLALSLDNTFDNIMLRCGNGSASANFSNIVIAATSTGVGFAATVPPATLSIQNLGGKNMQVSWTSTGTLQEAPAVNGVWTDSPNQANPQTMSATNSALFFRVRQ